MANFVKEGILSPKWTPLLQSIRSRRVNVQKPRAPHYERARVLALIKPQYADQSLPLPMVQTCKKEEEWKLLKARPDNPYENLMAKELFKIVDRSRLVAVVHANPISGEDLFDTKVKLKRGGMALSVWSKHTAKIAFEGTIYEPILQLYVSHNVLITSDEPDVAQLLKILKKTPPYVLMAGIVDKRFLSYTQLVNYSKIKDITEARAQLVATLNAAGASLVSHLNQHQTTLVSQLDQIAKIKGESEETER